jgi:hypothetical protein
MSGSLQPWKGYVLTYPTSLFLQVLSSSLSSTPKSYLCSLISPSLLGTQHDGGLVSLDGAPIRCVSIVQEGVFSYHVVDNLTFHVHDGGGCSVMNPLSGLTLPLPELAASVNRC